MFFFYSLMSQLEEKKEQLLRLNVCAGQLATLQDNFVQKRNLIETPELTARTWNGILASEFLSIRDEIIVEYDDIVNAQLAFSQQTLQNKIMEIQREIVSLETSIAAEKARLVKLARERKDFIG